MEGGAFIDERKRCARETAKRPLAGKTQNEPYLNSVTSTHSNVIYDRRYIIICV